MATHSSILAWKIPLQRSMAGYSPWGRRAPAERLLWPGRASPSASQRRKAVRDRLALQGGTGDFP